MHKPAIKPTHVSQKPNVLFLDFIIILSIIIIRVSSEMAPNDKYLRRTGFEIRSARNQSYIKEPKD